MYTAADIPGALRVGILHTDWPVMIPVGGRTSYLGDVLAIVVAEDRADRPPGRRAGRGRATRSHPPITDAVAAVAPGAQDAVWELDGNVLSRSVYERGDVDAALAASAHTLHEVFQTQRIEHAFLEPESTLAAPQPDGTLHVWSGGQGVWDDRNQIASMLGVATDQVVVELVANGGAFGGKEDMSNQAHAALAAWLLGRPVKCTLTREQSLTMHPKRHPIRIEVWAGCDADGVLTALRARMVGDSGPYASVGMKVLERAAGHACGPVCRAERRRRGHRRADEQSGVRRVPRVRRQPGPVRHGGHHGPAGREDRSVGLGDPLAQRRRAGLGLGSRARSWTTAAGAPAGAWTR